MPKRCFAMRALRLLLPVAAWCGIGSNAWAQTQDAFFNDETVQEVRLAISSRYWQTLKENADENTYYPADLSWKGVTVRNVGIRSRGSATRNGIKPGLKVDVNHYVTNQEFLGLKGFNLKNMYSDSSLVRESVTMKMFARMGIPSPREAHARLYVNNEYAGVYVVVEAIDRTFISRVFGAPEGEVERGGYLFEFQHIAPYDFGYLGSGLAAYAGFFKAQTRDTDSLVNIYAPLEEMIRTINEAADPDFAAAAGRYLDLRLFMKHLAVETFMAEMDGLVGYLGTNNFYLYRFRESDRMQFIPKDKDASLSFVDVPITLRLDTNVLTRRATMVPDLWQAYADALMQCANLAAEPAADDPRGWLEREIDRQTRQIAPAVAEDPVFPYSFDEFQTVVESFLAFAQNRSSFVSCEVTQMQDPQDQLPQCAIGQE